MNIPDRLKDLALKAQDPPQNLRMREFCKWDHPEQGAAYPYYHFLMLLTEWLRPALAVEIGTELGRGAFAIAASCPETEVHTIELHDQCPDTWVSYLGSLPNCHVHCGTRSRDWLLSQRDLSIDLAFIDGSHYFCEAMPDWYALRPLMTPGGIVCFDDSNHDGVRATLAEIALPTLRFDGNEAPSLHGPNGFACVQIPDYGYHNWVTGQ